MATTEESQQIQINLPYDPTPWQWKVLEDEHKFVVVVAGARSGKTVLALEKLIIKASMKPRSTNWYVAPTYGMAKFIAWEELKRMIEPFREHGLIAKINESELMIMFVDGTIIQLKGADKPDSLRGVGLDFLVLDEYATMRKEVWNEVLRPRTVDKNGSVLFIGTPKGYNHFHDLYQMELNQSKYWKSYHFKTIDNPYIPKEEIEQARRDMDPRAFRQEFEASFETFGGQVFTSFSREKHVKEFKFRNDLEFSLGVDFGWASPTAALFNQVDVDDNVFIFDEIRAVESTMREVGSEIRKKGYKRSWTYPQIKATIDPDVIYCDPAGDSRNEAMGTSSVKELQKIGFRVIYKKSYPGSIVDGVNVIRKWLNNGKLIIHPRCVNLIQAVEMYRYPEPKGDIKSEIPLKDGISDHWIDALRYFFMNRFPVKSATWGTL